MISFIHQTDIFHPHGDPDDHWDLATVYALASQGRLALRGVMLDYPPDHRAGDPATLAMAQLGHLTGLTGIPFAVGSMRPMRHRKDDLADEDPRNRSAAEWLCHVLEDSTEPMIINIVGACTDVALAGRLRPDLFAAKCRAVYLNAGAAHPNEKGELEYNVKLNPASYAAVFDLPCPVYWCPCWHETETREVGENGTWYSFLQEDVFVHLGDPLRNFFLYMLSRSADPKYLRYLHAPVDPQLRTEFGRQHRNMWSTAAIMHAAGMGIDLQHGLAPACRILSPLFDFVPIAVECADDGQVRWERSEQDHGRYIFHLHDPGHYPQAMTAALATLLGKIEAPDRDMHAS